MSFPNYAPSAPAPAVAGGAPLSYAAPSMDTIPLTSAGMDMLRQTRPWVGFISIVLTVNCLLLILLGAGGMALASTKGQAFALPVFAVYILIGVVNMVPAGYLRKYASQIRLLMDSQSAEGLEAALEAQKNFWRVVGILTAIMVALYAVGLFMALTSVSMGRLF